MIGEADDEISRAFRPGASPGAAGSRVTAPATQNKHICRNVAECVFMAVRHNGDFLMQSKSNYVAVLGTREDSVGSTSAQSLRTK